MATAKTPGQSFWKAGFQPLPATQDEPFFADDLDAALLNRPVLNSVLSALSK